MILPAVARQRDTLARSSHLRLGKSVSGGDSRRCVCRPVNTSFSAVALGCTAQCVKESKPVLNAVSRKCETVQRAASPPTCSQSKVGCSSWKHQWVCKQRLAPHYSDENPTVAFIGCSLRMRRHTVILHHSKYTSNSLVASTEHNYLSSTNYLYIVYLLTLCCNSLFTSKAHDCNYVDANDYWVQAISNHEIQRQKRFQRTLFI